MPSVSDNVRYPSDDAHTRASETLHNLTLLHPVISGWEQLATMATSKEGVHLFTSANSGVRRRVSTTRFILFYLSICAACVGAFYGLSIIFHRHVTDVGVDVLSLSEEDPETVWNIVPPSTVANLVWIPCYQGMECAKLTVPLDYADPDGPSAIIAMAKVPSKVPKSDKRYRGPILFNPGGPGGSGVDFIRGRAEFLPTILGDEYDLIGFDPRDGSPVDDSIEELQELYDRMTEDSIFGVLWGGRTRCSGWKVSPVDKRADLCPHFAGAFTGNTSYPILLIGNTADPVTPVVNAHTMSKGFNGSAVLQQHSAGHCSLSASSACTAKAVRAYFRDGTIPKPETVCQVESSMFPNDSVSGGGGEELLEGASDDERKAIRAWDELVRQAGPPLDGLVGVI
ncbi:hypothetical protein NM688_g9259 [Phlebia brevispora]|uniref:Uncharacterized protein n=1 Tax=Phlebia brevispora TaxID=194682 RepID=A0ACC1RK90_9APHY|nr:hypothetical protein NM688_g9259 [Phlebia brevispora]